jgi:Tol biopolymer transport system component
VVVAVALVIVVIQLNSGGDSGTDNSSGNGGSEPTLPSSVALLTRVNEAGNRELIAVDTDSGDVQVAVADPSYEMPTISPDRKWIVYLKGDGDGRVPQLARVDGSDSQPLLDDQMTQECPFTSRPAWNPDGTMLAFVCLSADQSRTGLWVVHQDGSEVRELVDSGQPMQGPTWGDDGRIYYVAAGESDGDPSTIWAVSQDGGDPRQLTDPDEGWASQLDWSDGGVLYLRSSSENEPGDAVFVTPDGDSQAFSDSGTVESPTASPDGKSAVWLEASSDDDELSTLWVQRDGEDEPAELLTGKLGPPAWGSR